MTEVEVRIERLPPMRVASAYGFGRTPEQDAIELMHGWAVPRGLREGISTYGFNNPDPTPGSPNYGYEIWLPIGADVEGEGDIKIKDFPGGLYAVTRCNSVYVIGDVWRALVRWREGSRYRCGNHQWLEKLLSPIDAAEHELFFDLYLPISE